MALIPLSFQKLYLSVLLSCYDIQGDLTNNILDLNNMYICCKIKMMKALNKYNFTITKVLNCKLIILMTKYGNCLEIIIGEAMNCLIILNYLIMMKHSNIIMCLIMKTLGNGKMNITNVSNNIIMTFTNVSTA